MKVLVTSDLHLSNRIWKHRPIEGDSYCAWSQIQELAIARGCSAVIMAGDILDKQTNQSEPVYQLLAGIKNLRDHDIAVYYNQGQHELQTTPWMSIESGAVHLSPDGAGVVSINGWRLAGCDYRDEAGLQQFLKSEAALSADILICHQVWKDLMGNIGNPQGEFSDVPENVKLLITGDYHESVCRKFGNLSVISPGSTHLRSISEPVDKYVYLLDLPEKGPLKSKRSPLLTRRRIDISLVKDALSPAVKLLEAQLSLAYAYNKAAGFTKDVAKPLVWLTHDPEDHKGVAQVTKAVNENAHIFFKPVKHKLEDAPQLLDYVDVEDRLQMIHCLDSAVDKKEKPLIYGLATALLAGGEPEQVLQKWIKEQTNEGS
jgi:predicted phosphodiesterase|tara:strand:+ start:4098 stop:5216 length:1119 start_codon:yes stop_codon:yes gene_type:complete